MSIIFAASEAAYATGYPTTDTERFDSSYARSAALLQPSLHASFDIGTILTPDSNGYWISFNLYSDMNRPNFYLTQRFFETRKSDTGHNSVALIRGDPVKIGRWTEEGGYGTFNTSYYYPRDKPKTTVRLHIFQDGANGRIKFYIGDSLQGDITLTNETLRGFDQFLFRAPSNYYTDTWGVSELIVADESLLGCRLRTAHVVGNGAKTDWDGSYTDVDESGVDFTAITTTDEDAVSTFVHNKSITQNIRGVAVTARGAAGAGAGIDNVLRIGGVDYTKTPNGTLRKVPQTLSSVWTVNPATGLPFTASDVSNLEFGVKKT